MQGKDCASTQRATPSALIHLPSLLPPFPAAPLPHPTPPLSLQHSLQCSQSLGSTRTILYIHREQEHATQVGYSMVHPAESDEWAGTGTSSRPTSQRPGHTWAVLQSWHFPRKPSTQSGCSHSASLHFTNRTSTNRIIVMVLKMSATQFVLCPLLCSTAQQSALLCSFPGEGPFGRITLM